MYYVISYIYIYTYLTGISNDYIYDFICEWPANESSSFMERVVSVLSSISALSFQFACPAHCSGSSLAAFIAGLGVGLFIGLLISICLGIWILGILHRPNLLQTSSASQSTPRSASARLRGYLHEH